MTRQKIVKIIIVLLFLAGLLLVVTPFVKSALINYQIETIHTSEQLKVPANRSIETDRIQPPTFREIATLSSSQMEGTIGELVIPNVDIMVPIFPSLTNQNLLLGGVSVFPERQASNQNVVIISHHLWDEKLLFGPLINVQESDYVYLRYLNNYYHYQIVSKKIVKEQAISVMEDSDNGKLTLITCDKPDWTDERLVVEAELVEEIKEKKAIQEVDQMIAKETKNETKLQVFISNFYPIILGVAFSLLIFIWLLKQI